MNAKITALHFKADKKLEDFIQDKLAKLDRISDGIIGIDVILKIENTEKPDNKTAELILKIKGHDIIAEKTSNSFEAAFDLTFEAARKQLNKSKEKIRE